MGDQPGNDDRLLTADEVAEYLGWHVQTVYAKAREGSIPSLKIGGARRFRRTALDAWIEEQAEARPEPAA